MSNQILNQDNSENEEEKNVTEVEETNNISDNSQNTNPVEEENDNNKKKNKKAEKNNQNNQLLLKDENTNVTAIKTIKINPIKISSIFVLIICIAFVISVASFTISNNKDTHIKKGVSIEGVDISGLSKEDAKNKVQEEFLNKLDDTIYFQYGENIYSLGLEQINVHYKLDEAIDKAYNVGRIGSIFDKDIEIIKTKKHPVNITLDVEYDDIALDACIIDISAKLPEQVEQPSYYIENGTLIITSGKIGKAAENEGTKAIISEALNKKNYKDVYYDIPTYDKYPEEIDVDKIHDEIYRDVKDAYYTVEPRMVYPEEVGVDFAESVDTVKQQIAAEKKQEYQIALKYTPAAITVKDLGVEAFPDQLATFSTPYVNNANRTTNLMLASSKINGTVIMPGETFSYNTVVGERTIAAGYRNAAIYENGRVVDGLGGGICQVSSTLYNTVLYANLDVVERSNHMFLTTYVSGGRDATVAYGSLDFKFKNNRDYPVKIVSSVGGGYCTVSLYGLKKEDDYKVEVVTKKTGSRTYQTYKNLYQYGQFVGSVLVSTDTYSTHS